MCPTIVNISENEAQAAVPNYGIPVFCVERSEIPRTRGIDWRTAPYARIVDSGTLSLQGIDDLTHYRTSAISLRTALFARSASTGGYIIGFSFKVARFLSSTSIPMCVMWSNSTILRPMPPNITLRFRHHSFCFSGALRANTIFPAMSRIRGIPVFPCVSFRKGNLKDFLGRRANTALKPPMERRAAIPFSLPGFDCPRTMSR